MRCFRLEIAPSFGRSLSRLPAMLACLVLLAGCRFGEAVSFFDEDNAIERAIGTFRERMGAPMRVLNISIAPDQITIRAQDAANRSRVNEWRLVRMHVAALNWDRVSGPSPHELSLINPDLEANLFELDEIDFAAATTLARMAVERAALADKARVTRMEIARQVFVVPRPSSGEIRWTVDVSNDRESVQVFADARGTIVGMNVDGTNRAKTLDILREFNLVADAARAFRFILGADQVLTRVSISSRSIGFETNFPDPSFPIPVSGNLSTRRVYTWSLNGLQRALGTVNADAAFSTAPKAPFGVDNVDWAILPKLAAAATEQLAMPQGRITAIELSKPANALGPPIILWKIEITDQNNEKGFILADTAGSVKQLMPPQSRRKPADWYDPKTMFDTLVRIGVEFGHDRKFAEITFFNDKVIITAENHMEPNVYGQILLTDGGFERFGTPAMAATKNVPFRIDDLQGLTLERIRGLETQTLATLKLPPNTISSITIGRGSMDPSPKGNVTIEIRAEEKLSGRAGRVNYEFDGTVIRAYLP
jgi:hypothetical protein